MLLLAPPKRQLQKAFSDITVEQQMLDMQKQLAQIATGSYTPSTDKDKP